MSKAEHVAAFCCGVGSWWVPQGTRGREMPVSRGLDSPTCVPLPLLLRLRQMVPANRSASSFKILYRETGAPGTTVGTQKDAAAVGNSTEGLQKI